MDYDGERTYQESDWAVRRWDWFNRGKSVEPLSFCQFWRTVLIWATLRQLLTAVIFIPTKVGGRAALAGVVNSGEWFNKWGRRHEKLGNRISIVIAVLYFTAVAFVIFTAITGSGIWSLIGMGMGFAIGAALYGLFKIGAVGLVWQAMVAAHHGICPPVRIVRDGEEA